MVRTGMEVTIGIFLHEYPPCCHEQGVGHDKEWFGGVWHFDYRGREEYLFESDKHIILFFPPQEGGSLFASREVWNEFLVEVAKSNEGLDCFY